MLQLRLKLGEQCSHQGGLGMWPDGVTKERKMINGHTARNEVVPLPSRMRGANGCIGDEMKGTFMANAESWSSLMECVNLTVSLMSKIDCYDIHGI